MPIIDPHTNPRPNPPVQIPLIQSNSSRPHQTPTRTLPQPFAYSPEDFPPLQGSQTNSNTDQNSINNPDIQLQDRPSKQPSQGTTPTQSRHLYSLQTTPGASPEALVLENSQSPVTNRSMLSSTLYLHDSSSSPRRPVNLFGSIHIPFKHTSSTNTDSLVPLPPNTPTDNQMLSTIPSESSYVTDEFVPMSSLTPLESDDRETPTPIGPHHVPVEWRRLFNYSHDYRLAYHQPSRTSATTPNPTLGLNNHWGDPMSLPKQRNIFRVYCQNINGLKLDEQGGDIPPISEFVNQYQCDVVGFSETNLDSTKFSVQKIIKKNLNQLFKAHQIAISTSEIPFETNYKPGGTLTAAFDQATSRFRGKHVDPMGRWSSISLTGKKGRIIHFVTVYQVVANSSSGPYTAYQQQASSLRVAGRDPNPKKAFLDDIIDYLKTLRLDDYALVVMGDLNEVVGHRPGFNKVTSEFDLVDVMTHRHPIQNEVPTYSRGTKRLDYIFCTQNIVEAVVSCGIEPFNKHIFSDHRGLYVDWDESALFGTAAPAMTNKQSRRLQSSDARAKENYILALHNHCTKHNVFKRIATLSEQDRTIDWRQAEALDKDITQGMIAAEKHCRYRSTQPWSPSLQQARIKVEIFKLALSMSRTHIDFQEKIDDLQTKYTSTLVIPTTVYQLQQSLRQAQTDLRVVLRNATTERKKFLQTAQTAATIASDSKAASKWKNIQKSEAIKAMYRKLQFIRRDNTQQSGLTRLEVPSNPDQDPKNCSEWTTVDNPEDITRYLLARNQKHFGQADGTPFTVSPLNIAIDFRTSTETCDTILEGKYTNTELDDLTSLVIKHLEKKTPLNKLPNTISEENIFKKFALWPEKTTTSPSGRHLGHYKSLLRTTPPTDARTAEIDQKRSSLATLHSDMINLALRNGQSYQRWKKVANIMLEKEPGNPKIHRLRVIHLYEADYNLILALTARALVHHAEDNKLLNNNLYGARPGRTAHDPVGIEEFVSEITRLSRKPCIKNTEDATACYDRIIPSLGNLASRGYGLHRCVALVQGSTLSEAKYHLKTKFGITEEFYRHCEFHPIYGTGQGSGNSPTIWLVISSVLFDSYESQAHGATFESPDRLLRLPLFRVAFVDDTNSYVNKFDQAIPPTPEEMIDTLKRDSQLWSDLLWRSGGALELPKCTYHYWNYVFTKKGRPFLQGEQVGPDVLIRTGDGNHVEKVPFRSAYESYKTLGYYKSPCGSQKKQFDVLKAKCDDHARIVSSSALSRREAWTYYFSMYLTSPGYPLPLCHFTPKELHKLETKSLPSLISKCGFIRTTSRVVLYGPKCLNGGGLRPFATEQGVGQVQYFFKHWTSQLPPGKALRIAMSWAQMHTGVGWPILQDVSTNLPQFDESHWLRSLRLFLRSIQGQLRLDNPYIPSLQREHDSYIMDHVLQSKQFTNKQIQSINYCRLYLQAVTVSDITNASGNRIFSGILQGKIDAITSINTWHTTNQANPDTASWKLWKKACELFTCKGVLLDHLEWWLHSPTKLRRRWPFYYDPTTDYLLQASNENYTIHCRSCQTFEFEITDTITSLPSCSYPVDVRKAFSGWHIKKYSLVRTTLPTPIPTTFQDYVSYLEPWEKSLLTRVTFLVPPPEIIRLLTTQSFRACSDGSAVSRQGTFGWVLALSDKTRLAFGAGPVDGHDPQSFRSEGQGMLSIVRLLYRLRNWIKSDITITGTLATDNSGLVDRAREQSIIRYPTPNAVFQSDWDIVEAIAQTVETMGLKVAYTWVKGHQDKGKPYDKLSFLSQLNVDADKHAGDYQSQFGSHRPIIPLSMTRPVALDIAGKTIHRHMKSAIRNAAHLEPLLNRMIRRYGWTQNVPTIIDWEAHRLSTNGSHPSQLTHLVKLCHDYLPAGKIAHRNNPSNPHSCPLCNLPDEDHQHILRCQHPSRSTWRTTLIKKLTKLCDALNTDPPLKAILLHGVRSWLEQSPFDAGGIPHQYHQLLQEQTEIGWYHVFLARFSTQWAQLQSTHLHRHHSTNDKLSGDKWVKAIGTMIITSWLELWKQRNLSRHGSDSSTKALAQHEQAVREIEILYSYSTKVLQRDRTIFDKDITYHTNGTTPYIRQWINTNQAAILQSAKRAKLFSTINVRTINSYFRKDQNQQN